jgi:hypothetical protein
MLQSVTLSTRIIAAYTSLLLVQARLAQIRDPGRSVGPTPGAQTESELSHGNSADRRGDTVREAGNSVSTLTDAQIEELTDKLAERREKLDYFYITAFAAILVFTFNNFNSPSGVLVKAPVWLVEVGWGSLIAAALCPLYVISVRFQRFAMNLDRQVGKDFDEDLFKHLRRRAEFARRALTVFFVVGVGALCAAYALGLNQIKR